MKIFAISLVKNEEDIIAYNLKQASQWADKIFVVDNASTDDTWQIVQELADDIITPAWVEYGPYRETIRTKVYHKYKHLCKDGDWWCYKLDADEIYAQDPRAFLAAVPKKYHVVFSDQIEYHLTHEDLEEFQYGERFEDNIDKIKYYLPTSWSEIVFFKYRQRLQWDLALDLPNHIGLFYPKKIQVRHYQFRSPQQIQKRQHTRKKVKGQNNLWVHEKDDWKEVIKSRTELLHDNGIIPLPLEGSRSPHQHRWYAYWFKRLMHGIGVYP